MILFGALLFPFISVFILYIFFKHKTTWWELALPLVFSLLFIIIMKVTIETLQVTSKEYWGSLVSKAEYYEEWNEYIHQTCTRSCCCDSKGNCGTETYDCSYVQYHPAEYWIKTTSGENIQIRSEEHTS